MPEADELSHPDNPAWHTIEPEIEEDINNYNINEVYNVDIKITSPGQVLESSRSWKYNIVLSITPW